MLKQTQFNICLALRIEGDIFIELMFLGFIGVVVWVFGKVNVEYFAFDLV